MRAGRDSLCAKSEKYERFCVLPGKSTNSTGSMAVSKGFGYHAAALVTIERKREAGFFRLTSAALVHAHFGLLARKAGPLFPFTLFPFID
jgi:hypothetical protein